MYLNSTLIIIQFLNLIIISLLLRAKLPTRSSPKAFLNVAYIYKFPNSNRGPFSTTSTFSCSALTAWSNVDPILWHQRLGHPFVPILEQIRSSDNIFSSLNKNHVCGACQCAKSHKLLFHSLHLVHNILLHSYTVMYGTNPYHCHNWCQILSVFCG